MKTTIIEVNDKITVYIFNKYKCFATISMAYGSVISTVLIKAQIEIEEKLGVKILMVRYDSTLNVVEFYITS